MNSKIQFPYKLKAYLLRLILAGVLSLTLMTAGLGQTSQVAAEGLNQTGRPFVGDVRIAPDLGIVSAQEAFGSYLPPAAPPSNDAFPGTAFVLDTNFQYTTTVNATEATTDIDPTGDGFVDPTSIVLGDCNSDQGEGSVWFSYTPVANINLYVDTIGSSYDTLLAIWKGDPNNLTLVTCNDDISMFELQSKAGFSAIVGNTYYIEVIEWTQVASQEERILNFHVEKGNFASIDVLIGGDLQGNYAVSFGDQKRVEYELDSGPVEIGSNNNELIIAALRDSWWDGTTSTWTSFVQMMGLPEEQLSDTYYFPSYNNISLSGQLRFGNVDTVGTWVRVVIGGVQRGRYFLDPSEQVRVTYNLDTGPVVIESETAGVKIIAALRDAWWDGKRWTSFSQLMGLPKEQLSDSYYFPSYNNVSLSGQLRFGNVDTVGTWVRVMIGGVQRGRYFLDPSEQVRVTYNLDTGPVVIESETAGVKIIAALRDAWWDGKTWTSFVQMMGLPKESLSDTYYFPSYNNVSLSGQLRFGNVDTVSTWVRVVIGDVQRGRYFLDPSEQVRVTYNLDSGPVVIESETTGVKIIANSANEGTRSIWYPHCIFLCGGSKPLFQRTTELVYRKLVTISWWKMNWVWFKFSEEKSADKGPCHA
jgi:hypothetical protein